MQFEVSPIEEYKNNTKVPQKIYFILNIYELHNFKTSVGSSS